MKCKWFTVSKAWHVEDLISQVPVCCAVVQSQAPRVRGEAGGAESGISSVSRANIQGVSGQGTL